MALVVPTPDTTITDDLQQQINEIELTPGPQGPTGTAGAAGAAGAKGDKGDQGDPGAVSATGTSPLTLTYNSTSKAITGSVDLSSKADASALTTHTSNTSNPHGMTKAQIGLGNVPNTDTTNAANITSGMLSEARIPDLSDRYPAIVGDDIDFHNLRLSNMGAGGISFTEDGFDLASYPIMNTGSIQCSGNAQFSGEVEADYFSASNGIQANNAVITPQIYGIGTDPSIDLTDPSSGVLRSDGVPAFSWSYGSIELPNSVNAGNLNGDTTVTVNGSVFNLVSGPDGDGINFFTSSDGGGERIQIGPLVRFFQAAQFENGLNIQSGAITVGDGSEIYGSGGGDIAIVASGYLQLAGASINAYCDINAYGAINADGAINAFGHINAYGGLDASDIAGCSTISNYGSRVIVSGGIHTEIIDFSYGETGGMNPATIAKDTLGGIAIYDEFGASMSVNSDNNGLVLSGLDMTIGNARDLTMTGGKIIGLRPAQHSTSGLPAASASEGVIVYDTTTKTLKWSNGSVWSSM